MVAPQLARADTALVRQETSAARYLAQCMTSGARCNIPVSRGIFGAGNLRRSEMADKQSTATKLKILHGRHSVAKHIVGVVFLALCRVLCRGCFARSRWVVGCMLARWEESCGETPFVISSITSIWGISSRRTIMENFP